MFLNKNANKTNLDSKKKGDIDEDESDIKIKMPKIKQMVSPVIYKKKVK